MRHLQLVGVMKPGEKVPTMAKMCSWCRRYFSISDYVAAHLYHAKVSHGCCPSCTRKMEQAIEDAFPRPAA